MGTGINNPVYGLPWSDPAAAAKVGRRAARITRGPATREFRKLMADFTGLFAQAAVGDFDVEMPAYDEEGEFAPLYAGVQIMFQTARWEMERRNQLNRDLQRLVEEKSRALREAQKLAGVGSWEWLPAGGTMTWSGEMYRLLSMRPARNAPDLNAMLRHVHPGDLDMVKKRFESIAKTRKKLNFEFRRKVPGRSPQVLKCVCSRKPAEGGDKILGTFQDVTAIRLAEAALLESKQNLEVKVRKRTRELEKSEADLLKSAKVRKEVQNMLLKQKEKFKTYLQIAPIVIVVLDKEGGVEMINTRGRELLEYRPSELKGRSWFDSVTDTAVRETAKRAYSTMLKSAGRRAEVFEYPVVSKSGRTRLLAWRHAVLRGQTGSNYQVLCAGLDITEQRKSEQLQKRLAAIVETTHESVISITLGGTITSWNKAAEGNYGYTTEDAVGQNIAIIVPAGKRRELRNILATVRRGDSVVELETTRRHRDGTLLDISLTVSPIKTSQGEIVGASAIARNISAKIAERRALAEAKRLAEEANMSKTMFLANMSHELRTPLSTIIGYCELVMEEAGDAGIHRFDTDLGKIRTAAKFLLELINNILDLSKLEAGKILLDIREVDVGDLLEEVVSSQEQTARNNGNRIHSEVSEAPLRVFSDPLRLRQILINLLSNACKFTRDGTIRVRADLETAAGGPRLRIDVKDTGIGMSAEQTGRIFEEFVQGDSSTTRKYGGSGLGLALVRKFTELLQGELEVQSQPGRGTRFWVTMPANLHEGSGEGRGNAQGEGS